MNSLTIPLACVKWVATHGPEAGRLRRLPENRESQRAAGQLPNGTAAVVSYALERLVSLDRAPVAHMVSALAGIPIFIGRGLLSEAQLAELDHIVAELHEKLRPCVVLGEFFDHPLGSPEQLTVVNRALNTSRRKFTRRSRVRSSFVIAEQQRFAKSANDPRAKAAEADCQSKPRDALAEIHAVQTEERIAVFLSKLRPKDRRLAERILEMMESDDKTINKAALHEESKSWSKNGRGIALPNIEKMCGRILEARLGYKVLGRDVVEAAPSVDDESDVAEAAADSLSSEVKEVTIAATTEVTFEDFKAAAVGDRLTEDMADVAQSDTRKLADGCYLSVATDSERSGASRMDRLLHASPHVKTDFGGPRPTEWDWAHGAGRAVIFPELPYVPDYQARTWEFNQRPADRAKLRRAAITDPISSPYLLGAPGPGYKPRYIGPRKRTERDKSGGHCVAITEAEIAAREKRSRETLAKGDLQRAKEERIAAERWARAVKALERLGFTEPELARLYAEYQRKGKNLEELLVAVGASES